MRYQPYLPQRPQWSLGENGKIELRNFPFADGAIGALNSDSLGRSLRVSSLRRDLGVECTVVMTSASHYKIHLHNTDIFADFYVFQADRIGRSDDAVDIADKLYGYLKVEDRIVALERDIKQDNIRYIILVLGNIGSDIVALCDEFHLELRSFEALS